MLEETEARTLLAAIAGEGLADRRDKALLAVMLYSFARVSAIVRLRVRDYENQRRRAYLALREKGGQHRRVPVHSRAAEALDAYLETAGIGLERRGRHAASLGPAGDQRVPEHRGPFRGGGDLSP